jgi:hypothetical protein
VEQLEKTIKQLKAEIHALVMKTLITIMALSVFF